jgi:hypothetical protein
MKKIISSLTLILALITLNAQSNFCATDLELEKFHEANPEMKDAYQQDLLNSVKAVSNFKRNKANGKIIIPLVIHVLHYNNVGNISKNQIDDGIRILNEDFNKLNADTSSIRAIFKPYLADVGIEFRLAKIDPSGNPTEGINRINSHLANAPSDRNKPKTVIGWDPFSYLNVWIVNSMVASSGGGTLLGFAQFPAPSQGINSTYGLVVRGDEWGSIESAQSADGRTATHEIGHCLDLLHPFQSACGSFCHASGDFICDTPPQFDDNNNSCNQSINSCSNDASGGVGSNVNPYSSNVPDQLENIMGYGTGCAVMFTEGQKTRMLSALNTYQKLDSISSVFNETQTGTNDGYVGPTPKPIVEIFEFDKFTCVGDTIVFNESSYGGPLTTYEWSFPGGTPSVSSSTNPSVSYAVAGDYDVTLKITNIGGVDSLVLSDYVHISNPVADYSAFNYVESFENATTFANEWTIVDEYLPPTFDRSNFAGFTGSGSLWINNLGSTYRTSVDQIISPSLKMSDVISPSISMEVGYRRKNSSSDDEIRLYASVDCGKSWSNILSMSPTFFAYDFGSQTSQFIPSSSAQWKTVTIPAGFINSSIKNGDNVKFMIEVVSGNGNNIFIDDFRINGQPTGIEDKVVVESDFIIYPNPAKEQANIRFNFIEQSKSSHVYVQNILGERVKDIYSGEFNAGEYKFILDTSELSSGIYFINAELDGERITRKLVIN